MRDCSTMAAFMLIFNSRCYVQGDKSTLDMRNPADLSLRIGCPPRRLKAPCLVLPLLASGGRGVAVDAKRGRVGPFRTAARRVARSHTRALTIVRVLRLWLSLSNGRALRVGGRRISAHLQVGRSYFPPLRPPLYLLCAS